MRRRYKMCARSSPSAPCAALGRGRVAREPAAAAEIMALTLAPPELVEGERSEDEVAVGADGALVAVGRAHVVCFVCLVCCVCSVYDGRFFIIVSCFFAGDSLSGPRATRAV